MVKSTRTRQCLLSHVSSGTRTLLNVHLFGEEISFVGAACFHRDCPDALAASSGNQLQQPSMDQCVFVHTSRTVGLQMGEGVYVVGVSACTHVCAHVCHGLCLYMCAIHLSHVQLPLCLLQLRGLLLSLVLHLHQEVTLVVFVELQM